MKNILGLVVSIALLLSAGGAQAAIDSHSTCPDLAGTFKTPDGATFTMTSQQERDGTVVFSYDRDTWVADGQPRDSHTGTLNPQECPSIITCQNKTLTRSYTCFGFKSVEFYSLDNNGNIHVFGQGMGLNGNIVYTRIN